MPATRSEASFASIVALFTLVRRVANSLLTLSKALWVSALIEARRLTAFSESDAALRADVSIVSSRAARPPTSPISLFRADRLRRAMIPRIRLITARRQAAMTR